MAESLLERLRLRAAASECVGILQVWHDCGQQQARHELHLGHGSRRSDAEARRVIAVVDAAAGERIDPDASWD
jgi:hypothetical protein